MNKITIKGATALLIWEIVKTLWQLLCLFASIAGMVGFAWYAWHENFGLSAFYGVWALLWDDTRKLSKP